MGNPNADESAVVPCATTGGTTQVTLGTTALFFITPADWLGRWVRITASDAIQYYFYADDANVTEALVVNQASGLAGDGDTDDPYVITNHASTGDRVGASGGETHVFVPSTMNRFVMIAEAAATEVFMRVAGA